MKLTLMIKNQNDLVLQLKRGSVIVDEEHLTISQNLDTLLILTIDKILVRNNIDRLSLKSMEIRGKIKPETVSGMIIRTIQNAIKL